MRIGFHESPSLLGLRRDGATRGQIAEPGKVRKQSESGFSYGYRWHGCFDALP